MNHFQNLLAITVLLLLAACSSGGGNDPVSNTPTGVIGDDDGSMQELDPQADRATYNIVVQNFWSIEEFPEGYPDNAHLSLIGGAVHNAAVSFWSLGEPPSAGLIDVAENGRIDILLADEVRPAILNGTASSEIEVRHYTGPPTVDGPGEQIFEVEVSQDYPLITLLTMLGPSPDWFVGVTGLSLMTADENWIAEMEVELPLYDGGSRSNMTPVMHGPSIKPPEPVAYVAYNSAKGVYEATTEPQNVAKLLITRSN